MTKTIILIGFMGAGKTTVGQKLANACHHNFLDLDDQFVKETHESINEFMKKTGEDDFRQMETKILKEHINDAGIISTGGGIIESKINRQIISDSCAQVIFLEADFSTILRRLSKDTDRPLLRKLSMQALLNRWSSRQPLYKKTSDVVISTNGKSPNKIVNELIDIFNLPDNPLTSLRSEIDSLDTQILNLISQRMTIVKQVADVKKNVGMSVIQSKRMDKMRLDLKTEFKNNPNISEDFIDELVSLLTSNAISKEVDLIS